MPLLNDTLVWLMKRRMPRIQSFMEQPLETQEAVFFHLISAAQYTEWGKAYNYSSIASIKDFQERVPISSYEELFPYIERIMQGEENVLWHTPIQWFSKSSGTTNAVSKFIPVSQESIDECHVMGGKDMLTLLVNNKSDTKVFTGKGLSIGGSLSSNTLNNKTTTGDVSAVVMKNLPIWAQFIRTPSLDIALMEDWEVKIQKMAEITSEEDVTSILGVPTWTMVLIEKILEIKNKSDIREIWPNFEFFVHGAVAFQPYREVFKQKIFKGKETKYLEIYNASEGFFGIQDDLNKPDEMLLMLDYGIFYEFIPMSEFDQKHPKAITLAEVELDKTYAIIISTNAGLWRYKIGDTVKFTSLYPFRISITGRTKHFINAFGEELVIENADTALAYACQITGAKVTDYTAGPQYMGNGEKGSHQWLIEFSEEPEDLTLFSKILDKKIRELNSDYNAKRYNDLVLTNLNLTSLPKNSFYTWLKSKGKLGGQHKIPRLSNNRTILEEVLSLNINEIVLNN
ncbi:MAG: GH3 auxin-responsive promoter family protein [Pseudarcicella sp.]|nr:GH3 auxin-responsive promoter family protein [Pseudarcicella sp.]MBP6410101.1 GH3 auxin-responsive promoter family protein [Pseudarcicella sp.]